LIALLLPSLGRTKELARRAVCAANLRNIQTATVDYGKGNMGRLIVCRGRAVQKAFNAKGGNTAANRASDNDIDWVEAMATVGMAFGPKTIVGGSYSHYRPAEFWNCPSRDFKSQWEVGYPQLVVAYQYFGGIERWTNPYGGSRQARSPLSMTSKGGWAIAADAAMKIDGVWGGGRDTAYQGLPAHQGPRGGPPEGGNQAYFDGSVNWVAFQKMIYIHSWSADFSRMAYFYQEDLGGWVPPATAYGQP
jgi:hypothetical protein